MLIRIVDDDEDLAESLKFYWIRKAGRSSATSVLKII